MAEHLATDDLEDPLDCRELLHGFWHRPGRVFVRHYCAYLAGTDLRSTLPDCVPDVRAAHGYNSDIAENAQSWRTLWMADAIRLR